MNAGSVSWITYSDAVYKLHGAGLLLLAAAANHVRADKDAVALIIAHMNVEFTVDLAEAVRRG